MFLNIGLNFLFIRPLQNGGPALATSFSAFFSSVALLVIFYRRHGSFGVWGILQSVAKFSVASVALAIMVYGIIHWPGLYAGHMSQKVMALGVTIGAGAGTYFGTAVLLRSREVMEFRLVRRTTSVHSEA